MTTTVVVLGSTGSIGTQALDVVARHPDRFRVTGLAAGGNTTLLAEQARRFRVPTVAVADPAAATELATTLPDVEVLAGPTAATELAGSGADIVLNGIVGSIGLAPTLAALRAGSRLALANKESLIVGGDLVHATARSREQIVPVDSEHSALAQCLRGGDGKEVTRVVVTASGGPFRGRTREQLADVSVADALAHPTWSMGAVITINSATLANKGLEVIETHLLFDVPYDRIEVVVHPQSVVHGMVEFCDGAVLAKLSPPDMRLPIQLALSWPDRLPHAPARMDWATAQTLTFEPVDRETFPMLDLAYAAGRAGGTAPAVYNAANEEAVAAFRNGRLTFLGIGEVVAATLEQHDPHPAEDLEQVLRAEDDARRVATTLIAHHG